MMLSFFIRSGFVSFVASCWLATAAQATILLNEIHINPPGTDGNHEFIELRSTTNGVESCDGLTLLIIDNNGNTVGAIMEALSLNGLSTGSNGLLLIGDDYDRVPLGGPWAGFKSAATTVGDPSGTGIYSSLGADNLTPHGGLTFLLVRGWTGLRNATLTSLGTVDVDGNELLDWSQSPVPAGGQTTQPWTAIVDRIGFQDLTDGRFPYVVSTADLSRRSGGSSPPQAPNFPPDSIARRLSRGTDSDASLATAWYGGEVTGTAATGNNYDPSLFFGDFRGQVTPGQPNLDSAAVTPIFLINEVAINPPGTDGNSEYVEIINTAASGGNFSANLAGVALIVVNSNNSGDGALGKVLDAWDLGAYATGNNGLLLLGNDYPDGFHPWGNSLDPATQLGDPSAPAVQTTLTWSSMGAGDLGDNNGFTLLLVRDFTGLINQDLDTNDDGILDEQPWSQVLDSTGFDQTTGTGKTYATGKVAPSPAYDVDHLSRKLGNTSANSTAAWYGGDYGGNSPTSISLKDDPALPLIGGFRGVATPGRANLSAALAPASVVINEVHHNPVASPDDAYEYLELLAPSGGISSLSGLTLVIATTADGEDNGKIRESIDLSVLSTGSNGLVVLGDGYDTFSPYDSPQRLINPLTNREDPPGLDTNNIWPNDSLAILIVKGTAPVVGSNVSAISGSNIVDSIAFGSVPNASVAVIDPGFTPENLSRNPANPTPNASAAWFSGRLDSANGDASLAYTASYSGTYRSGASPGRLNHAGTPTASASVLINEIHINPPGVDDDEEFIEIRSTSGGSVSTNGYTLLLVDGDGTNTGPLIRAWSLDGLATGSNGLLLLGSGYSAGNVPWAGATAPAAGTSIASLPGLTPGLLGAINSNGTTSLLLVRHFYGKEGDDLDTPNNGTMDVQLWSELLDAVGFRAWDSTLLPPAAVGRVYGGVNLGQTGFSLDTFARYQDVNTPLSAVAWYGGDVSGTDSSSVAYDTARSFPPLPFVGKVTPGQPNISITQEFADYGGFSEVEALALDALLKRYTLGDVVNLDLSFLTTTGAEKVSLVGLPLGLTFNATTKRLTGVIKGLLGESPVLVRVLNGKVVVRSINFHLSVAPHAFQGNYAALLETAASEPAPTGLLKITVTATGTYTATLNSAGQAQRSARGSFSAAPGADTHTLDVVFPAGKNNTPPATTIQLTLPALSSSDLVTGQRDVGGETLRGFRLARPLRQPASVQKFTLAMTNTVDGNGVDVPAGTGTLTGTVDAKGVLKVAGFAGDAQAVTGSLALSQTHQAIFWSQPYKNKGSYLGGVMSFANLGLAERLESSETLVEGLKWRKVTDATEKSYPQGFAMQTLAARTSRWIQPTSAQILAESLGLTHDELALSFLNPLSVANLPAAWRLTPKYALINIALHDAVSASGKGLPLTGGFSGNLALPSGAGAISGVFLQDAAFPMAGAGLIKVPLPANPSLPSGSFQTIGISLAANAELVVTDGDAGFSAEEENALNALMKRYTLGDVVDLDLSFLTTIGAEKVSLVGLPLGLTFNATTKRLTGTIKGLLGESPVLVRVMNGKVIVRSINFHLSVAPHAFQGSYAALLETAASEPAPTGLVRITVTATGTYTATLNLAGQAQRPARGSFSAAQGAVTHTVNVVFPAGKNNTPPATTIQLTLPALSSSDLVTGQRDTGGETVRGFRLARPLRQPASVQKFTLAMTNAVDGNGVDVPAGTGTLTGTVDAKGVVKVAGFAGDAQAVTGSFALSQTHQAIFWSQPYKNKGSYLGGVMSLANLGLPERLVSNETLVEGLKWRKVADATEKSYSQGFAIQTLAARTSRWIKPTSAQILAESLGVANDEIHLTYDNPLVIRNLPKIFRLSAKYALLRIAPNTSVGWTGKGLPLTGAFTGSLALPTGASAVSGVLLQDAAFGSAVGAGLIRVPLPAAQAPLKGSFQTMGIHFAQ